MKPRIIGIDVARALAVIGMIIVNFKVVLGASGEGWLKTVAALFDGKAAATFVVLAGVGLALMSNSAIRRHDRKKLRSTRRRIVKRALFLFLVGLSYLSIWPADILHFYGIYMLVCLFFLTRTDQHLLLGSAGLIFLYPLLIVCFDYEAGWDFATFNYTGFWTASGFFRNLFYNGFHPVIPWTAFMLFGLWYGKQDLRDHSFLWKSLRVGGIVFVLVQLLSLGTLQLLSDGDPATLAELTPLFGTEPMPPLPLYMLNGLSISVVVISGCILLAQQYRRHWLVAALTKTGQLALTFYVAHVVLGMGLMEAWGPLALGEYSLGFSLTYALFFSVGCILFAVIWLRYQNAGPLEWVMRKLTN